MGTKGRLGKTTWYGEVCSTFAFGKRMGKITTQAQSKAGELTTYLMEIFKNHKLIKIFQKEGYELERSEKFLDNLKERTKKIAIVFVRASPIMETLTGIMIAIKDNFQF